MNILLHQGTRGDSRKTLRDAVADLQNFRPRIHEIPVDDLVDFFAEAGKMWRSAKDSGNTQKALAAFVERDALKRMLSFSLRGDYHVLDRFLDLGDTTHLLHAQPRGLAVHWLAGNVPILGLYSLIQTLLTKNVSLLKASRNGYEHLCTLIEVLGKVTTKKVSGSELLNAVSVVLIESDDRRAHELLSRSADIRIAWGGHEAMDAILSLPKNFWCEDVVYGPKYSFGVIDKAALPDYERIVSRLAFDVCTFDQYACSSPHTIFIEETPDISIERFAEALGAALDRVGSKFMPNEENNAARKAAIIAARAKYSMLGKVYAPDNLDWTVIASREEGLAEAVFSRVIFVRPIGKLDDVATFVDRRKQTLGFAVKDNDREAIADRITLRGVDRCPRFGEMTLFESPWDGSFAIDRMVRWVTLVKA